MRSILFVKKFFWSISNTSHWHRNGRDGVSNHQPHHCLFISLFRRRSKKISKFRDTGLCEGHSPFTGEFTAQSNAENVSIWWRYRDNQLFNFLIPNNGGIRSNNLTLWSDIHVVLINSYFTYTYGVSFHILLLPPCIIDGLRQFQRTWSHGKSVIKTWWHENTLQLIVPFRENPRVTGGFPPERVSDAEPWCFFVCLIVEQTLTLLVMWDENKLKWKNDWFMHSTLNSDIQFCILWLYFCLVFAEHFLHPQQNNQGWHIPMSSLKSINHPDSKVHGASIGPQKGPILAPWT